MLFSLLLVEKESISEAPSLFSDEEENEVPSGVKSVNLKVDNAKESPEVGHTDMAKVEEKVRCLFGFLVHL